MTAGTTPTPRDDEQRQLESARRDLVREFQDRLPPDEVTSRFTAIVADFAGAPVRSFIPVLARRRARSELMSSS